MRFEEILSASDMIRLAVQGGLLPFFAGGIPGFSVEEHTPSRLWFSDSEDGPWEWKGPAARSRACVYGKFYSGKAGFVSKELFPGFACVRRDGYDFEGWVQDGRVSRTEERLYRLISEHPGIDTKSLKAQTKGEKGYDRAITALQEKCFIVISDFRYAVTKAGIPYGWGIACYDLPERLLGVDADYDSDIDACRERLRMKMQAILPEAEEKEIEKLIG